MNKNRQGPLEGYESSFFCRLLRRAIATSLAALFVMSAEAQSLQAQEPAPEASAEKSSTEEAPAEPAAKEEEAAESPAPVPATVNREKVAPDEEGRIQFNYVGQPWAQVLQDFADAAGYSLDWQELPSDTLNLTTQRTYTPKEAHDLMNRHLLARGFTMLVEGEVLSIVKVDKLDPSLVPRAEADELEDYAPHDFMRVTFDVPLSMDPAKAAEDVKILLSPNAKVTPLLASRRLLVIDAVINLRDVRSLMYAEQKENKEAGQPREFVLKYHRADYVAEQVLVVLGLDPNVIKTPDELKLETQRIQLQMKLAEKAKDVSKMIKSDGPKVYIAVNRRRNSILVNAPVELMLLVERTVKQLDVSPVDGAEGEMALTLKQYQLVVTDPREITKSLEDSGRMDPRTRLQSDRKKKTLLATATRADHERILAIIKQLDVTMPATIEAGELDGQQPHDFVRVRFRLPLGMSPSEMATKVKPLLSENAKVLSLATNRELLIVDTVEKLLEARELITAEMDAFAAKDSLQEFVMQHRRAEVVVGQVLGKLGLNSTGLSAATGAKFEYQGMSLFVTVNTKSNSFRVNAHPDLLKLIEATVKQFDIPETTGPEGEQPAQTLVLYEVAGQNISSLIEMLREIGGVGPLARLQTGPAAGTLYAIAGKEDHGKIRSFLDTIAPETIKTVEAANLESLPPQDLVRVRFQLPLSATVTTVAAELRGITTSRGIVQSLESSKQIIVLDSAENLINIREVVKAEIAALETQSVIKEFPLQHRNASEMVEQVLAMLGFDPVTVSSPYQLRTELQAMKLFITANQQRNSLMVNAAPDKLKLIEEIVKQLDVPQAGTQEGDADRLSMVPYKVTGQDVRIVVKTLQEIGNLSPRTRLQGDLTSQTLYAYANSADHEVIRKFVDKTNPNSIRRVEADKLEEYASKEKVRVRFQLPLTADVALAATQIRGILGTTGQVQSLEASKQLIVDGTVANLIEVRDVLRAESKAITAQDIFREFRVEHRRAEEIAEQILTMLELSPTTISSPRGARFNYRGMKLFVSIKPERNTIVVGARQELLQMVEQIVKQFDVAEDKAVTEGAEAVAMVMYDVPGQNVSSVIEMLRKLAELGPLARIDVGPSSETLYAIANEADQEKIRVFLEKIAPEPIRTVTAEKLDTLPPQALVRVRFQLPLSADVTTLATQLRGITTPQGIVQSLESSKQIIVLDTAENLMNIRSVLEAESAALAEQNNIREFPLKHRRATEMVEQVLTMLGLDPATITYPTELRLELQKMKLFISANQQRNSLMVNAAADKLELVEKIIKQLDVPEASETSTDEHQLTLVPYEVKYLDVASAEKALREIANIGPTVRLQADPAHQTLYAYATKADHDKIERFLAKTEPGGTIRIDPDKLEEHAKHEQGRVRFQLPLTADVLQSAAQIRGLLGKEGVVQSLEASKQLVVSGSVETLLEVRDVLEAEEEARKAKHNIREFPVKHRRAEEMIEQVLTMLGLGPKTISSPRELRNELQRLNLFITANQQRNSLVVNADAGQMEIVERIVKQLDVPSQVSDGADVAGLFMVPYKVTGQDVASMVLALNEIGNLGPRTRLQGDSTSQTLYAYATKADHETIREFVTKIDPNFIRQVEADKLEEYQEHELARVRFQLPQMADMQVISTQIQGVVGPRGRVQSLDSSKQLVVIDTVANLIGVREILRAEEVALASQDNIREFPLQHRRAQDMIEQVLTMLGVNPELSTNPRQMQEALRELKLFITTNELRNSLVVNAPAEKMLTVEQIVKQLDVPIDATADDSAAPKTMSTKQTMVSYQVASGDVTSLVKALEEIGYLNPRTRLQADPTSKTLYAYANKADHQKIRQFVDDMDPNIVRRVHPDELEDNPAHEVVRAIFQLPLSSDIDSASRQIEGVLGVGARVQSLDSSKQLVVVDTVANLIDVRDLLYGEQLAAKALEMPLVFPLEHRRASYVADQVMILLGLDPSARKTSAEVQFEAQRMQMMQQSGQSSGKLGDQTVYIAVNRRQNSLLVNTPPEKAPLIERTIEQIDVPVENGHSVAMGKLSMEKYQTMTADTDSVIGALEELGNLDPKTQLQSDSTGKVIYAYATATDHATIKKMIAHLDGTGRRPEVRWLPPHLPAQQMAGTIMELIVPPPKKKENNLPWYYYRNRDNDKKDERNDGFRALADVENNRLLVWATEAEMEEVDNLIEKLSARSDGTFNDRRKVRRLELRDPEATRKLLEQLRTTWSGENKLEIAPPPPKEKPKKNESAEKEEDKLIGVIRFSPGFTLQPTWLAQVVAEPAQDEPQAEVKAVASAEAATAPPIKITINKKGEIILASEDTEALDRLQMLIEQLSPAQTEFKSFQLHYISVIDVVYNLENYFENEMSEGKGEEILDWWGRKQQKTPEPGPLTLGKRPPIRFIDDVKTNTLLVANASASQLRVVEEMINLYDQPPNPELYYQRRTEAIKIQYSEATDIANSLKEVYRDLLSSKDKEFRTEEGKSSVTLSRESSYVFGDARDTINGVESPVLVRFSGALAIGVDEISNSVVVSAREAVLKEIKETITKLDRAAMPETVVRVHSANGVLSAGALRQIIGETLSEPWTGGQPGKISRGGNSRSKASKRKKRSTKKKR